MLYPERLDLSQYNWIITKDNDEDMYTCQTCGSRMTKKYYDLAVGTEGLNFCPYCGKRQKDMTERELIAVLEVAPKERRTELLQAYIQRFGSLSYAGGDAVRRLLKGE